MQLDENALLVLQKRYLLRDEAGNLLETPDELFRRVASAVSQGEDNYPDGQREEMNEAFYRDDGQPGISSQLSHPHECRPSPGPARGLLCPACGRLARFHFRFGEAHRENSSNGGWNRIFLLPPPTDGTTSFRSTMGVASGPVSFIRVFNCATEAIKQGGTRRGANMGILRVDHPDIVEFVTIKRDPPELTNFNLSVAVTDDFMRAYEGDHCFFAYKPEDETSGKGGQREGSC